jgi:hypothetical protein
MKYTACTSQFCKCGTAPLYGWHCELSSGTCSLGPSPYNQPPLSQCPTNGKAGLSADTPALYDAMCLVTPAFKCALNNTACRLGLLTTAPLRLCRLYCDSSPLNQVGGSR